MSWSSTVGCRTSGLGAALDHGYDLTAKRSLPGRPIAHLQVAPPLSRTGSVRFSPLGTSEMIATMRHKGVPIGLCVTCAGGCALRPRHSCTIAPLFDSESLPQKSRGIAALGGLGVTPCRTARYTHLARTVARNLPGKIGLPLLKAVAWHSITVEGWVVPITIGRGGPRTCAIGSVLGVDGGKAGA